MDCIDTIREKLEECSNEQVNGCDGCPVSEDCGIWFSNIPAYIQPRKCRDYILQALALKAKKRRLIDANKRKDDSGHEELRGDDAGGHTS